MTHFLSQANWPSLDTSGVMATLNHTDPTGGSGLACDTLAAASAGVHAMNVTTSVLLRDTTGVRDLHALPTDLVEEQARIIFEDSPVQMLKLGFAGSPEALSVIAELISDYPDCKLLTYLPDLSWWTTDLIERYLDALYALVLPQTDLLCGNRDALQRWLLPDWRSAAPCSVRELAMAAQANGCEHVLATGISDGEHINNVLSNANSNIVQVRVPRMDAAFIGAGDTLSASLAALMCLGESPLSQIIHEAVAYTDQSLQAGFMPGMGQLIPDRLFWAIDESSEANEETGDTNNGDTLM